MTRPSPMLALTYTSTSAVRNGGQGETEHDTLSEMPALSLCLCLFVHLVRFGTINADPIINNTVSRWRVNGRHMMPQAETLLARTTNPVITSTSSYNVDQGTSTRNRVDFSGTPSYAVDRARGAQLRAG